MVFKRVQVSLNDKLLTQIDRERGSISRSSYVRAILESARLSDKKILKIARRQQGGRKSKGTVQDEEEEDEE